VKEWFRHLARNASDICASWQAFIGNCLLILLWLLCGPIFQWSESWQLIVNTGTTVVTYLLVFLVMNTQSRDTTELRLKIDELILATASARNSLLTVDTKAEDELKALAEEMHRKAES
jgi:low affinity Fe/Cu permease